MDKSNGKFVPVKFTFERDTDSAYDLLIFYTPQEAIKYFESKGYAMSNWTITMTVDTGVYFVDTEIELITFNVLTDQLVFD